MNYLNIEYEEKIYNQKDEWFEVLFLTKIFFYNQKNIY